MLKMIHLSDLHVGQSCDELRSAIRIKDYIINRYFAERPLIVITGDCVHHGYEDEYKQFHDQVLEPLKTYFTVLNVPGNHDYGSGWFGISKPAVQLFAEHVSPGPYPHVHLTQNCALIGLDSADPNNRAWFANGVFAKDQFRQLRRVLTENVGRVKIVYFHHHPFLTRLGSVLVGGRKMVNALREGGVSLLLFGHKHWDEILYRGNLTLVASRKVTEMTWGGALKFRVIDVDEKGKLSIASEEIRS